jgi:hypothetical protein
MASRPSSWSRPLAALLLGLSTCALAQTAALKLPDAQASDPITLGWMKGSPPPADKVIRSTDGSSFRFPQTRWVYSHMRELGPTSNVSRGLAAPAPLPRAERDEAMSRILLNA